MRFKEGHHLHNIKAQGEAARDPGDIAELTGGGSTKQQVFSVDATALCWKMPSRTLTGREEKSVPGCRASRNRRTLSQANAAGDSKLKPRLTDHPENPRALENRAPSTLRSGNGTTEPG